MPRLHAFLAEAVRDVETALDSLLPTSGQSPSRLHEAVRWSIFAGGKRFRPALVLAVGDVFEAEKSTLIRTAAAAEMIHTFSLIHDDLPAMDDDDLRRGKATCHKKFDEATAILAGDVLQTLAFKTIADDELLPVEIRLRLLSRLAAATGTPDGMVAGQQLDLEAEGASGGVDVEQIHALKTGALINFAAEAGAIIGNADETGTDAITAYARFLGLLFQITDDLLDVSQPSNVLGKTAGKDAAARKATYPSQFGLETAKKMAIDTHARAVESLAPLAGSAELLCELAGHVLKRLS